MFSVESMPDKEQEERKKKREGGKRLTHVDLLVQLIIYDF
jgi:hypothetical protein